VRQALIIGNSDGIGLGLTRRLLAEGWAVTGLSRRPAPVDHENYTHTTVDVTTPAYRAALEQTGALDLCVYAAGVGSVDPLDFAAQTGSIAVNLLAAAQTVEVVLPGMLAAGAGHFIGLSSLADALITPAAPGYAAGKAGLSSYLISLAPTARAHGVHVTTVRFGFVDTKLAQSPVKPMMITVDRAVEVLMRCVRKRPVVVSYPRRMALLTGALRPLARAQARLDRGKGSGGNLH